MATATGVPAEPQVPTLADRRIPAAGNALKIGLFIAFLASSFALTDWLVDALLSAWVVYGPFVKVTIAAAMLILLTGTAFANAMVMLGMAVLAHEAVHRTLFRDRFRNDAWGGRLSALALIPFHANRRFHLTHHAYAHQRGRDPEHEMHHRSFAVALLNGAFLGLKCQYRTWARQLTARIDTRRQRRRAAADLLCLVVAASLYFGATSAAGISPLFTSVPMILAFPVVFSLRALCDHYGIPEAAPRGAGAAGSGVRQVTGWVILTHPWLEWLWSSVNYHEVHHKFPYLAHCDLREVYWATRDRLPYLTAPGYLHCLRRIRRLPYYTQPEDVADYLSPGATPESVKNAV